MHGSLLLLIGMNLAIGAALLIGDLDTVRSRLSTGVAFGAMFLAVALAMPSDLFRRTFSGLNIVFYQEGVTDTVGVAQSPNGQRIITYEDQRGTAGTNTYPHNYLLGHLPFLLHDGQPKLGLHICFGVGNSLSAMTRHASIERIDSVELSPHALDAAAYFWTNDGVIDHPKVRMITDDGRNFVMATEETYDVIELEPPETFTAGVINLYTLEFYRDVAARLNDDGVFVQWLPIGQGPVEQEKMLFRAFFDVFPHGTVWQQLKDGPFLLVGTKSPLRIDYEKLRGKLRDPTVRRDLASADIRDAEDLLRLFVLGPEALRELVRDVPPTTDDRTVLDFSMPRYVGSGFGMGSFRFADETVKKENRDYIWTFQSPVVEHLTNTGGDGKGIQRRVRARPMPAGFETWNPKSKAEWTRWISDPR
jgi:spermidine synthase